MQRVPIALSYFYPPQDNLEIEVDMDLKGKFINQTRAEIYAVSVVKSDTRQTSVGICLKLESRLDD